MDGAALMLYPDHFRRFIIRPSLHTIGLWSEAAENLLLGTAAVESNLQYLKQLNGPALGIYQIEPNTHNDIWANFLEHRERLASKVAKLMAPHDMPHSRQLTWNFGYSTAMARMVYYRRPEPLPDADDIEGLGAYWKAHYNTRAGAGTVERWMRDAAPIVQGWESGYAG